MSERFVNGARVSNQYLLSLRSNLAAAIKGVPAVPRPPTNPDALAMAKMHPRKGWAKRYARARGIAL